MKQTRCMLLGIFLPAVLLSACHAEDGALYVSLPAETTVVSQSDSDSAQIDVPHSDFTFDVRSTVTLANSGVTFDDENLYLFDCISQYNPSGIISSCYRLDLAENELIPLCGIPACKHDMPACIENREINNPLAVGDTIWYTEQSRLMAIDLQSRETTTLFTNSYGTEFERLTYPDQSGEGSSPLQNVKDRYKLLGGYILTDDIIYLYGPSYVFTLDRATMQAGELIKISDNVIYSLCIYDGIGYVGNDLNELYRVDFSDGTVQKLGDQIVNPTVYNGKLYFIRWENGVPWLCTSDTDGTNEEKLIEDCYVDFCIYADAVFYSQFANDRAFYHYQLSNGKKTLLTTETVQKVVASERVNRVYAVTDTQVVSWQSDGSDFQTASLEE